MRWSLVDPPAFLVILPPFSVSPLRLWNHYCSEGGLFKVERFADPQPSVIKRDV